MPILTSGQITINNIIDTLTCIIHSDESQVLADKKDGLTLTCRLFNSDGEVDSLSDFDENFSSSENEEFSSGDIDNYYYIWKRNGEDWREYIEDEELSSGNIEEFSSGFITVTGKQIELTFDDFLDSNIFSCMVYDYDEYQTYLNSVDELIEPSFLTYGEINIDTTVKKWMTFDDTTGLWIRKTNGEWTTLTDERGYHIYKILNPTLNEIDNLQLKWNGSFAEDSLMVPKIRLLYTDNIDEEKHVGRISVIPSSKYGWRWMVSNEGQTTELRSLFVSSESRQNGTTEINSIAVE